MTHRNNFLRGLRVAAVLLAFIFLVPALRAQPTEQTVKNRFLLVFDTSKSMKPRLESVEIQLKKLLATSLNGQLHVGDSIGVWTFGQDLRTKEFPLQVWDPDNAVGIASNLVKFVGRQSYGKASRLEVLQPLLNRVVQDSERLTVVIFTDGGSKISGTPSDDAINHFLQENSAQQKKAREPLLIVLRTQLGEYVGTAGSLPPQPVSVPPFPPLPLPPPPPAPKPTNAPPPAPVAVGKPLIVIGKKPTPIVVPPPATNPPPPMITPPAVPTNAVVVVTNPVVAKVIDPMPTNQAPALAALPATPDSGSQSFLFVVGGLLVAALVLGVVVGLRFRRKEASLISQTMDDRH